MLDRAEAIRPATQVAPPGPAGTGLLAGTEVMTLRGPLAVERIEPGMRVVTRAGALAVVAVEKRVERFARLVRVCESALAPGRPEAPMHLAAGQPILLRDWRAPAMTGEARAMVPAWQMADGEYIRPEAARDAEIVTLVFAAPAVIYAGGLELGCAGAQA